MEWLLVLAIFLIILVVLARKLIASGQVAGCPYTKTGELFSPAERSFLSALDQAVGEEYRVFGKVRVADVVSVKQMSDRRAWQRFFNRISAKHFDFLLCSKASLYVVAAIELNDQSHQQRKRKERDAFLVGVCEAIGLPLVQVPAQRAYSVPELRAQVLAALGVGERPLGERGEPSKKAARDVEAGSQSQVSQREDARSGGDAPACPKCGSPMARRRATTGANAGQEFWGCSAYPSCRCIISLNKHA